MRIRSEDLVSFRELYAAQYGQDLSEEAALETASSMLRLIELAYKPMTRADYDGIKSRQAKIRATESYRSRRLVA